MTDGRSSQRSRARPAARSRPASLWRPRTLADAFALGFPAAAVIVALFAWLVSHGEHLKRNPHAAARPHLLTQVDKRLGLSYSYPFTWLSSNTAGIVRLTSPDRTAAVALVSAPSRASLTANSRDFEQVLLQTYRPARLVKRTPTSIAGRQGLGVEIIGINSARQGVRIDSIVARAGARAYAIELVTGAKLTPARLAEARAVLGSIRFLGR